MKQNNVEKIDLSKMESRYNNKTLLELREEYFQDLNEITERTFKYNDSPPMQRLLRKNIKQKVVVATRIFKSSKGRRYLAIITNERLGSGQNKDWYMSSHRARLIDTPRGTEMVLFYGDNKRPVKLTTHFFERYKERFTDIDDWKTRKELALVKTTEDIMAIYFKRNLDITWIETEVTYNNKVHIFSCIPDGVALMQWDTDKQTLQANTFLSRDMLSKNQKVLVGYAEVYSQMSAEDKAKYAPPCFEE